MKRLGFILVGVSIASAIYYAYVRQKGEAYSLYKEVREASHYIASVSSAESGCYQELGRYLPAADPERYTCGALNTALAAGEAAGFSFEINAGPSSYEIFMRPASTSRLISLYTDKSGEVRFGTRGQPATRQSRILHVRH